MQGNDMKMAAKYLEAGQVVAIPTETVYGLAANAYDPEAVRRIFTIKKRPFTSPLIVHTYSLASAMKWVKKIPYKAKLLADHFWPGGLTLLLEKEEVIPSIVTAGLSTVGVRIPAHPVTQELLRSLPFPVAAPSANPFGYISPTTAAHVAHQLGSEVAYILDGGPSSLGLESTIIGFQEDQPVLYRQGSISDEAIQKVVGPLSYYQKENKEGTIAPTSGTLVSHYAPRTPFIIGDVQQLMRRYTGKKLGVLSFNDYIDGIPPKQQFLLSPQGSLTEAASRLFQGLHYLDSLDLDQIIGSYVNNQGIGKAINDRLKRAAFTFY